MAKESGTSTLIKILKGSGISLEKLRAKLRETGFTEKFSTGASKSRPEPPAMELSPLEGTATGAQRITVPQIDAPTEPPAGESVTGESRNFQLDLSSAELKGEPSVAFESTAEKDSALHGSEKSKERSASMPIVLESVPGVPVKPTASSKAKSDASSASAPAALASAKRKRPTSLELEAPGGAEPKVRLVKPRQVKKLKIGDSDSRQRRGEPEPEDKQRGLNWAVAILGFLSVLILYFRFFRS